MRKSLSLMFRKMRPFKIVHAFRCNGALSHDKRRNQAVIVKIIKTKMKHFLVYFGPFHYFAVIDEPPERLFLLCLIENPYYFSQDIKMVHS